jgi:hypothetical protein
MLRVSVPSADVHKGPSVVTPVIGQATRGTALTVSQNLGSWVKVPWPAAPDGVGYVHVTMGQFVSANGQPVTATPSYSSTTGAPGSSFPQMPPRMPGTQRTPSNQGSILRPSHVVGLGGLVASPRGYGVTARVWGNQRIAIPLGFTRDTLTSPLAADRVTSTRFEWGLIYSPIDRLTDYVWVRPYGGAVASYGHQTLRVAAPDLDVSSDNGVGYRFFGGSEFTFASVPQVGVSLEVSHRKYPTPFAGFETKPLSLSLAGHWYVK